MQWEEHSRPSSVMLLERYLIESNQEKITDNHKLRDSQQNYLPVICKSIKAIRVKERQEWLQTRDQRNIPTMHSMCSNVDPLIIEDRASCSVMLTLCDPSLWDIPGRDTGVGCPFLLQGIFSTQGSNPGLPHCRKILYCPSHQGSLKDMHLTINETVYGVCRLDGHNAIE